ncbi:MAG: gliding motility protein GldL [Bacteroidaceae bacterium]|nr:gliding motility protein GldL [Bacteroidaceae bacterium]
MNPIAKLQKWMDSPSGQVFMNYAYSWGAAVVVLGALFKLTHIPGANEILFISMITEVLVFFISGFEKTYDKVPRTEGDTAIAGGQAIVVAGGTPLPEGAEVPEGPIVIGGGGPAVIGGGAVAAASGPIDPDALAAGTGLSAAAANLAAAGQAAAQAQLALEQIQNGGPAVDANQIKATDPASIEEAITNYAEELAELTEVFSRVKKQAERMSTDSEEMENLNRSITGIATVYELQLRNISKQVSTIEQIDEQTRRMAQQIEELNNVYARMIKALTVNMKAVPGTEESEQ